MPELTKSEISEITKLARDIGLEFEQREHGYAVVKCGVPLAHTFNKNADFIKAFLLGWRDRELVSI